MSFHIYFYWYKKIVPTGHQQYRLGLKRHLVTIKYNPSSFYLKGSPKSLTIFSGINVGAENEEKS